MSNPMRELACTRCGSVSLRYPKSLAAEGLIRCGRCNAGLFRMGELRRMAEGLARPGSDIGEDWACTIP